MNQAQREDMAVAVIDATAPLYTRIAELEKELEVVSESEASLLTESLNVCDALGIDTSGDYDVVACVQQLRANLKAAQEQLQELASVRPVLDALRRIHQNTERRPQTGNPIYWTLGSTALIATGPDANAIVFALNFASYDTGSTRGEGPK